MITRNAEGYEVWKPCPVCTPLRKAKRIMKQSRITEEFQSKSFDNFKVRNIDKTVHSAKNCAEAYTEFFDIFRIDRKNSIALLGVPGCGKTHLLMAVSNDLLRRNVPVIYFPWVEGFNELKANLDTLDERIRILQQVDVLFIDDMFKGRKEPTEFQQEQAFAIINHRYLNKLPILVSSECDIDTMCGFNMALGSRIYEMCKDYCVVIKGDPKVLNYRLLEN